MTYAKDHSKYNTYLSNQIRSDIKKCINKGIFLFYSPLSLLFCRYFFSFHTCVSLTGPILSPANIYPSFFLSFFLTAKETITYSSVTWIYSHILIRNKEVLNGPFIQDNPVLVCRKYTEMGIVHVFGDHYNYYLFKCQMVYKVNF